jgi:hypothetical protein
MPINARAARERLAIIIVICIAGCSSGSENDDEWTSKPIGVGLARWEQFPDSCIGKFVAKTPMHRSITLQLEAADSNGSIEITPELRADSVKTGDAFDFLLTETRCRGVARWRIREQPPWTSAVH